MVKLLLPTVSLAAFASIVSAHGYQETIEVNGKKYPAWHPFTDPYITPEPVTYARKIAGNGPVEDFTGPDITCNAGGNTPAKGIIPIAAGDKVYMAKCTPDCANFKGDSGDVWVKIDEVAFNKNASPQWGSDLLAKQGATWTVTVPPELAPGEYLLRHEILGLHVAGKEMGAQFYPACIQLDVTSGGSVELPSGVALPGAYSPDDTDGILVELWEVNSGQVEYIAPGGPVWSEAAPQLNG
ncbi:hypothetical protein FQN54_004165 [Arachnomyces sp. PD_36]|nr:hypothetical protein FQN54_004165 [Arachnomyces sp. PD_36]